MQAEVSQSQVWPALQQLVQPHRVLSAGQRGTQVCPTACWPQGHLGGGGATHLPDWQLWPVGQVPWQSPPQPFAAPQALPVQLGTHWHFLSMQLCPVGQVPEQVPPQPSEPPHVFPAQLGVQHAQIGSMVLQTCPAAQPSHRPPQPSSSLQVFPVQSGTHSHTPALHAWFAAGQAPFWHLPPQPSSSPQFLPLQFGRQQSQPTAALVQISPVPGQPLQTLPQPSATPHPLVTQLGTHVHFPSWQV